MYEVSETASLYEVSIARIHCFPEIPFQIFLCVQCVEHNRVMVSPELTASRAVT